MRSVLVLLALAACDPPAAGDTSDTAQPAERDSASDTGDTAHSGDSGDSGITTETGDSGTAEETGDTGDSGASELPLTQADFIDISVPVEGDVTCLDAAPAEPDSVCIAQQTLQGAVEDFQSADDVPDATWAVYASDDPLASPDSTGTASRTGAFETLASTCTPLTLGTSTPEEWEETVPTYSQHVALAYGHIGLTEGVAYSMSVATSKILPSVLGVEWKEGDGLLIGEVVGCDGGPVGLAQAYAHDGLGGAPATEAVFYIDHNGLPSARAEATHADYGSFMVMGLPPGEWTLSGFAWTDELVELGGAPVTVVADSVTMVRVVVGRDDGVAYPDICFAACDEID